MTRDDITNGGYDLVRIEISERGGHPLVTLAGEIDLSNAQSLRDVLARVPHTKIVVIDMTSLEFIDSTGLSVIAQFGKRLRDDGGHLHLVVTRPAVRKVLAITSLDQHFNVVEQLSDITPG